MNKKDIDKKTLNYFTKEELIECILNPTLIVTPIQFLYQNRIDKNHKENEKILDEIGKLISSMESAKFPHSKFQVLEQIDTLNKKIEKNWKEDDKLTKILYGGNDD